MRPVQRPHFYNNPLQRLRHIPGQSVTYLNNPKVATKSIELSLWSAHDPVGMPKNPHAVRSGPFLRRARQLTNESIDSLLSSEFFSVVRNPYSRFLSGYLNKVKQNAWRKVSLRLGMSPNFRPCIEEFLACIKRINAHDLDAHFRPQHMNLMHGFVPLHFVGYLEDVDAVKAFLGRHKLFMESNRSNATNATSRIAELLKPEAIDLIHEIYERDFTIYGYSTDPAQIEPIQPIKCVDQDLDTLRRLLIRRMDVERSEV